MVKTTVKMDKNGRILIPRKLRDVTQITAGNWVNIKTDGKTLIIEASQSVADKYYGIVHVEKWPKDLANMLIRRC